MSSSVLYREAKNINCRPSRNINWQRSVSTPTHIDLVFHQYTMNFVASSHKLALGDNPLKLAFRPHLLTFSHLSTESVVWKLKTGLWPPPLKISNRVTPLPKQLPLLLLTTIHLHSTTDHKMLVQLAAYNVLLKERGVS